MRIYPGQARTIARDLCDMLIEDGSIEIVTDLKSEAIMDINSVLQEYIRTDREITDEARETARERGLGNAAYGRIKRRLAKERSFGLGDDAVEWIVTQLTEILLYSGNIEEVYADDLIIRKTINKVIKMHSNVEDELDREVRGKLKNLEEGSNAWDVEYERAMGSLKRNKGLV